MFPSSTLPNTRVAQGELANVVFMCCARTELLSDVGRIGFCLNKVSTTMIVKKRKKTKNIKKKKEKKVHRM